MTVRHLVLRVPSSGPRALIGPPNDFATEAAALARISALEQDNLVVHHTYLETFAHDGDRYAAMDAAGIIY